MAGGPLSVFRVPETVRRRLEVAHATAVQALIETYARCGVHVVAMLEGHLPFDDVIDRFMEELALPGAIAVNTRMRVLVGLERREHKARDGHLEETTADARPGSPPATGEGWRRFRPAALVRTMQRRQQRQDEIERLFQLGLAQTEEAVIQTHIENALDYVALLDEHQSEDRALEHYIDEIGLSGCRAQTVVQRSMCRLADARFPQAPVLRLDDGPGGRSRA
jgi:hypothetical protein